eukprot:m.23435 g.23435  ORF g.23435 m.23435 type:complete len:58 (+) comp14209_c0_seq1:346-519(+)
MRPVGWYYDMTITVGFDRAQPKRTTRKCQDGKKQQHNAGIGIIVGFRHRWCLVGCPE